MALDRFYTSEADTDLAHDVIAEEADLYIQKYEYSGSGVYAIETGGTSTLTPATSPAWTVDDYLSTVATNLLVVDDNSVVAAGKVTSNTATAVTFDESALLLESDATTAATLTVGNTYDFYVLTPSSTTGNTYGPFWGYTEGIELNINDTFMKFKRGIPKTLKFKDLEEREITMTGGHVNYTQSDVIEAILSTTNYGSQTSQYAKGIGSNPGTPPFYRLTFTVSDRNSRAINIICRKCQFGASGNIFGKAESGHYMMNFNVDVTADGFYPVTSDMIHVIRAD